jgi:predicted RNA binding protein YcfA (HicA-like mRNA interferase family)
MPPLTSIKRKKFEKFLKFTGCNLKRISGDHLIYDRIGLKRPVIITNDKDLPVFIVRNNLRTLGISPEEFLEILKRI